MAKPKVLMFAPPGEPKAEDSPVQVFYTTQPEEPYEEMARIDVGDTDDKWCMAQITKKAREIGADAVIILGRVGSYGVTTGSAVANGRYAAASGMAVEQEYGMSALAIRFKTK